MFVAAPAKRKADRLIRWRLLHFRDVQRRREDRVKMFLAA
jgi:hypothetical protein